VLLAATVAGCHKEEQAVKGVAQNAVNAEHRAQATAGERDEERTALALIPLPTKSLYNDIRDPGSWTNPFLSVGPEMVSLRVILPDENPSTLGVNTMLRPQSARRQQLEVRVADLDRAVAAIPAGAWHYGRVIAVAESQDAAPKDRPKMRRNLEAVIRQLNDLGIVVEEWPSQ
jgi:hypothetical protein